VRVHRSPKSKLKIEKKKSISKLKSTKLGVMQNPSFFFYVLITTKIDESVILEDVTLYYYTQHLQCKFINSVTFKALLLFLRTLVRENSNLGNFRRNMPALLGRVSINLYNDIQLNSLWITPPTTTRVRHTQIEST